MPPAQEMQHLKDRIAQVYARREALKAALERGERPPRAGLAELDDIDRELSGLDSRYKALWDASHPRAGKSGAAGPLHPAARWARETAFTPAYVDCITAIALKILDAKCKMDATDQTALLAIYDVVKGWPGQGLGDEAHAVIEAARRGLDPHLAEQVHAWRLRAEAHIPKPVMKGFKQWLRAGMPAPEPHPATPLPKE